MNVLNKFFGGKPSLHGNDYKKMKEFFFLLFNNKADKETSLWAFKSTKAFFMPFGEVKDEALNIVTMQECLLQVNYCKRVGICGDVAFKRFLDWFMTDKLPFLFAVHGFNIRPPKNKHLIT